jgi:hypothetical protein
MRRFILPASILRAFALLGAASLWACKSDCPPGSTWSAEDRLCHLSEEPGPDTADDTGDTEDTGSTEPDVYDDPLGDCTSPDSLGPDPLWVTGSVFMQDRWFLELTDIVVDEELELAYASGQAGVFTLDISDPAAPWVRADHAANRMGGRVHQLELAPNGRLYGTHREKGLIILDRSEPDALTEVSVLERLDLSGMALIDDGLLVATHLGELLVFDRDLSGLLSERAMVSGVGQAWEVVRHGTDAWVGSTDLGVVHVDLTERDAPIVSPPVAAAGGIQDLTLSADGTVLYAAAGGSGVEVFSLDTPSQPESLGTLDLRHSVISVALGGDTLWASSYEDVAALDLTDPRAPRLINTEQTEQWAMAVAATETHAVVADWAWVHILEVDASITAPDLDESTDALFIDQEGGQAVVELHNLGSETLQLTGLEISETRLDVSPSSTRAEPGEAITLTIDYTGGGDLDADICLASTDPDEPLRSIRVVDGATGSSVALGSEAPDFALEGLDGQTYRLSDHRGVPVVLVYFATW